MALDPFPRGPIRVAVAGRTKAGKTTLRKALTGDPDEAGIGRGEHRTTRKVEGFGWHGVEFLDTPGVAARDGEYKNGHPIAELTDIQRLDLREVDKVKPRLALRYIAASAAEGAGLAVSGGEILAAGGAIAGAGAGAAPGAGTVLGAMAADAAAVLLMMTRAIARTAAYYGYDTELPQERVFALGVLNFGLAKQTGKSAAYLELNKLVQALVRNTAWDTLNKNALTRILKVVYERLSIDLTKRKLGQAVPFAGVAIGAS